ncbi:phospholipid transport system substrate-binding protein [Nitrosomonas cryotolerans]|uniref:Phospholipid transport system substrate-binding protein n=1 Tax=Nitrosomonas cryotolerans ATCC 49181 TaxID=1131553 RepID=A0A1N6J6E3_9PROT|nr:ABC transporter substrate-binding protein [Nitrosomonas cryotolerans]SFP45756.1 phospholipid transport system substrate-binding protein [Nitrosomonas cryotolerans]SIO39666.1 phospholipid transport system substrate-binding protein [Nitrosomonas cryotolerans ATCC 49181]
MKKYFGIMMLAVVLLLVFPAWAKEVMAPDILVDETVQEVMDIIKQDSDIKSGNKDRILDLVENKILPHFDFTRMTQLAMGKNWAKAASNQQSQLIEEFRTLLVRTYSNSLSGYQNEIITVNPINDLGNKTDTMVKTRVNQGKGRQPVPINYSMEKTAEGWKVYDVTVAGVSLVTNYRGSFNSQIRKGGVEGLIKTLTEKNRSLEGK